MICKVCNKELNEIFINDVFDVHKHSLCYKCFNKFPLINKITIINGYECLSLYAYKGIIKDLIFLLKAKKDYELKDIFLEYFIDLLEYKYKGYVIVYAPSFHQDDIDRGFNHVEAIFSSLKNKKIKLFSKKENYKQSDQKFGDRKKIIEYISIDKSNLIGVKKVLIVDDVLTSGSTLNALSSLLYKEGVKDIKMLTISKVVEN